MKRRTALITGIPGFVGSHLAEELLAKDYSVVGTYLEGEPLDNLTSFRKSIKLYKLDITNASRCKTVINQCQPDYIFHLAAFSSVGQSYDRERQCYNINIEGTLNMLEAAGSVATLKKFVFISSSECYGVFQPSQKTLRETQPFNPVSPYAISKAAAERICLMHYHQRSLLVTIARSFNHSGPRQNEDFVIPAFAKQIANIEAGNQKPIIMVGNLTARRDLSDVRDIVRGYRLLAEKGRKGEAYHFSSGRSVTIKKVLDELLKLSYKKITVRTDKNRLRKNDIPVLRGSNSKAVQELHWQTRYSLKVTLRDTLNYWREKTVTRR